MSTILSMILAGGEGTRLYPLTSARTKPAVPFGGNYRIIDFVLSNFINSDLVSIYVLTQFKSHSLMSHLRQGWRVSGVVTGHFIDPVPAQMRTGKRWYEGTADAIFQNLNLIYDIEPDIVCIFGGDHIYSMDVRQMIKFHGKKKAALTVAAIPVPVAEAHQFGVIEVDENWRMIGFEEKPKVDPKTIPGDPGHVLASMGNYIFNVDPLLKELIEDADDEQSSHDFGKNIIPKIFPNKPVFVYDFFQNNVPGMGERERGYWRDVGTIDSYWDSSMDLVKVEPIFNLYNRKWPIRTYQPPTPPAKFVHVGGEHAGYSSNSVVSSGCILSGAIVENSILGYGVRAHNSSRIVESVIMDNVEVGANARISKAIIDKNAKIAPNTVIGEDLEADRQKYTVSENGIVVIPKGAQIG
ncbi:MAG: glucose-1-phosphate adenylyltransferase [SAR324 cluster bacterium]|nr:glucose-1-phosphate adenylyltransferase [SAR324 cluster bacterium]